MLGGSMILVCCVGLTTESGYARCRWTKANMSMQSQCVVTTLKLSPVQFSYNGIRIVLDSHCLSVHRLSVTEVIIFVMCSSMC